jgi:hypothetical protein
MLHAARECHEVSGKYQGEEDSYLSQVELSVLLVHNTFDLKEGSVGACVAFAALVTEYAPFAVESVGEQRGRSALG